MAILNYCSKCNRSFTRKKNSCPVCNRNHRNVNKFWINLTRPNGTRKTKVFEGNLTAARRLEAKLKTDIMLEKNWGIKKAPFIHDVYKKFEKRNQLNRKNSGSGTSRWRIHIKPYIRTTKRIYFNPISSRFMCILLRCIKQLQMIYIMIDSFIFSMPSI